MPTASFAVYGRVQGVGFRAYVREFAEYLELEGGVWNCRDGSVGAVVRHPAGEAIDDFERALWNGPGRVDKVSRTDAETFPVGAGFHIWPTR